ncbi:hydrogenase nickel incorporation protein HypB [Streptomyces sp. NPDC052164]|uniref:hydrogenase nickel incorporation protein HypB n=1 Tax=Streptomyces sp. NPDC052164 TaxID=3155529 RepID=UPI00343D66A5
MARGVIAQAARFPASRASSLRDLNGQGRPIGVIEGDQETMLDAERISGAGGTVVQVNTGAGCHLDAEMVRGALTALAPETGSLILVENVGNLVCPALFDLGEGGRAVIISVTEGTDRPLKYPYMFAAADLVIINKIDLLPYVDFDSDQCEKYARSINPDLQVLKVSATTGEGMTDWYDWLGERY